MLEQSCDGSPAQQQPAQSPFYWVNLLFLAPSSEGNNKIYLLKKQLQNVKDIIKPQMIIKILCSLHKAFTTSKDINDFFLRFSKAS